MTDDKLNLHAIEATARAAKSAPHTGQWVPEHAAHIAASSPDVVLALVARIRELEADYPIARDDARYQHIQLEHARTHIRSLETALDGAATWLEDFASSFLDGTSDEADARAKIDRLRQLARGAK